MSCPCKKLQQMTFAELEVIFREYELTIPEDASLEDMRKMLHTLILRGEIPPSELDW